MKIKRTFTYKKIIFLLILVVVLVSFGIFLLSNWKGDNSHIENQLKETNMSSKKIEEQDKNQEKDIKNIIGDKPEGVLKAIKEKNMVAFSEFVHPQKGVRFSPYAYVDFDKDIVFSREKVRTILEIKEKYLWGLYDGTGEPIKLTPYEYFKSFVYDEDYLFAEEVGYNRTIGKGNSGGNITNVYKNTIFVEYHFSGFNPDFEGKDWRSLRLVFEFEKDQKEWYLIGIIHDSWTI